MVATHNLTTHNGWHVRCLDDEKSRNDAKALLYDVYIKELQWMFAKNNPTGFAIEQDSDGRKLLTDALDNQSVWFGAFDGPNIIAVMRMVYRNADGHLDISRYPCSQKPHIKSIVEDRYVAEVQRCAVLPQYRSTTAFLCLLNTIVGLASGKGIGLIATTPIPSLRHFLVKGCHALLIDEQFSYSDDYYGDCSVVFVPVDRHGVFLKSLSHAMTLRSKNDESVRRKARQQKQIVCKL